MGAPTATRATELMMMYWRPVLVDGGSILHMMLTYGSKHMSSLAGKKNDLTGKLGCIKLTFRS